MKFEKFKQYSKIKAPVLLGAYNESIVLPLFKFKNQLVEINNHIVKDAFAMFKLIEKCQFIIDMTAYEKEEIGNLSSINNILNSRYNGTDIVWKLKNFDVNIMEYISPEPAVLQMTREYLKIYDRHHEEKVYTTLTRREDPQIVYGLERSRLEYSITVQQKVEYRQRLLDVCGGDKDYRDYAMFYVRNIEGKKNGK